MGTTEEKQVVLIVDDDVDLCHYVEDLFKSKGYEEIYVAYDFHGALEALKKVEGRLGVAYVDINLPGDKNGIDLLLHIDQYEPNFYSYAWTGDQNRGVKTEAMWVGAIYTIAKPLDDRELLTTLQRRVVRRERATLLHDSVTRLLNREVFEDLGTRHLNSAHRRMLPVCVSLIAFDADNFKEINDSCGHDVGDDTLRTIADAIRKNVRELDHACRPGGDEFWVLQPGADHAHAEATAMKIAQTLTLTSVRTKSGESMPITASAGVGTMTWDEVGNYADPYAELYRRADKALYEEKERKKRLRSP